MTHDSASRALLSGQWEPTPPRGAISALTWSLVYRVIGRYLWSHDFHQPIRLLRTRVWPGSLHYRSQWTLHRSLILKFVQASNFLSCIVSYGSCSLFRPPEHCTISIVFRVWSVAGTLACTHLVTWSCCLEYTCGAGRAQKGRVVGHTTWFAVYCTLTAHVLSPSPCFLGLTFS